MQCINTIVLSGGFTAGKLRLIQTNSKILNDFLGEEKEILAFKNAQVSADRELSLLEDSVKKDIDEESLMIFEAHRMLINDLSFESVVLERIHNGMAASEAVQAACEEITQIFDLMDDSIIKERVADIKDISNRLIAIIDNDKKDLSSIKDSIVVCDELAPSDVVEYNNLGALGIISREISKNSHTAIIARGLNIPLVSVSRDLVIEGSYGLIDSKNSCIVIDPNEEELKKYRKNIEKEESDVERLEEYRGKKYILASGRSIKVTANISSNKDAQLLSGSDAEGVGLFRSEFLFMNRQAPPDEEEQLKAYISVVNQNKGNRVVIRTADIGSDKRVSYLEIFKEDNPALGIRGIRHSLRYPEIFMVQLRAICRASAFGRVAIMFPMITTVEEVKCARRLLCEAQEALRIDNIDFDENMEVGVMIETPAAALISNKLSVECDFFSIGTNDLTQYTLAADRLDNNLSIYYDIYHESIKKLIEMTVENAHREGKWVGICGELAMEEKCFEFFKDIEIDELSVAPSMVLRVRARLCGLK